MCLLLLLTRLSVFSCSYYVFYYYGPLYSILNVYLFILFCMLYIIIRNMIIITICRWRQYSSKNILTCGVEVSGVCAASVVWCITQ
jgi:hypothetical protein